MMVGSAHFVTGLFAAGIGVIFFFADRQTRSSRALALCLFALGLRLFLDPFEARGTGHTPAWVVIAAAVFESLSLVAGIEWVRRIAENVTRLRRTVNVLLRLGQALGVIYGGMVIGYVLIAPAAATSNVTGMFRVRGYEWAIFAPIIGSSAGLTGLALLLLRFLRTDPAESLRLRAFAFAAPFLLAGLVVREDWVPVTVAFGLLCVFAGAVAYLIVQSQRGQFMSQFLSPEVARQVQIEGLARVLQRERRQVSVLFCDLRGFTAYARERSSGEVMGLLEAYYRAVGEAAGRHGGTVKDHAGDGVMILMNAPLNLKDYEWKAAQLGLELAWRVRAELAVMGVHLGLGVGIASGEVSVGAIKGAGRLEYVAVGATVNLAARLCQRAEGGEVLVDARTHAALQGHKDLQALEREPESLKGFDAPVPVYALVGD
ncbi:MAG TPA: adenylate/guanylate cyclase domain-containing protein [Solimonas sp.]|nr:adenylate/guanylate cyclase domain-containing protein [Solimonas sp.]